MNSRTQTLLTGLVSGLVQGNLLLIIVVLLASRVLEVGELVPAWEAATISGIAISFVVGLILADLYDTVKAILFALVVALGFAMPLVSILNISITASPEQGYAETTFFGLLAPAVLFIGILVGLAGALIRERGPVRPQKPLAHRTRVVIILGSIVLAGLFGGYAFSVVTAPNFSVTPPPTVTATTQYYPNNQTYALIVIPFNLTVNPVRGYTGNVTIRSAFAPYQSPCSPAYRHIAGQTSYSCQETGRFFPGIYVYRYRATDGSITHDFYVSYDVS